MTDLIGKLSAAGWNDRIEALERLDSRLRNSACTQTEASDLISAVTKVMVSDKHPKVIMAAANLIARSATTMKRDFAPFSKQTLNACLVGFRKKQPAILSALRIAADASVATMSIETVTETVITCLGEKSANPTFKEEAMGVLNRALQASLDSSNPPPTSSRRAIFKHILSSLASNLEDRTDTVRDAACNALASARRFLADEAAYARIAAKDIDDSKKVRIDQAYQKLSTAVKKVVRPPKSTLSEPLELDDLPGKVIPSKKMPNSTPLVGPSQTKKLKMGAKGASQSLPVNSNFTSELHMSDDEVKDMLFKWSIPEPIINNLTSTNWKERLESIDRVYSAVSCASPIDSPAFTQSLIRFLLRPPGFKETNVQVKCRLLDTLASLMQNSKEASLCESLFDHLSTSLVGMICTPKLIASCEACFMGLEQCCGLAVLGDTLLRIVSTAKVPKSAEQTVLWLSRALERASNFCMNYQQTIKRIKEGFESSSGQVRHAYITLSGAIFYCLTHGGSNNTSPPVGAFKAELENSANSAILKLLQEEFKKRECMVANAYTTPRLVNKRQPVSPLPHEQKTPPKNPRRATTVLSSPSETLQQSLARENRKSSPIHGGGSYTLESENSPFGLSTTFSAVSVPILTADFKAKKTRLAQLTTGTLHPSRQRLELDFLDAGMHENLRRLLSFWDSNPTKTKEVIVLLTQLLLHPTPSRKTAMDTGHHHPLSDTLANIDLIFHWMAESCFSTDRLDLDVVAQSIDYLDELISRLANAKMTLLPIEVRILLPWPLLASHVLERYFCQSKEHSSRLTNLLLNFCHVLPPNEVYTTVVDAISTITETMILNVLFVVLKLLFSRFQNLLDPSVADIKAIAQYVGSSDKQVNRSALECLKFVRGTYTIEQISTMAGNLTDRDRAFLEDALNQDVSAQSFHTPMRPKSTPYPDNINNASYTNNPSILASISRSQIQEDSESFLKLARRWIVDVLLQDDRTKECQMVTFLISNLISTPLHDGESSAFDDAFLALSHLDFLHHSTATRDLLLPQAPELFESLGIQMDLIASGWIPPFAYSSQRACRFVRATAGLVINIFRADFLTRNITANSLFCLIGGLLHLHNTFKRIRIGEWESLVLKNSLLSLLLDMDVAQSLEEDIYGTLSFIHEKLVVGSITTYIQVLTNLISTAWNTNEELEKSPIKQTWLTNNNALLHLFDLTVKEAAKNKDKLNTTEIVSCLEDTFSRRLQQSNDEAGATLIAFAIQRLTV
nr:cytoskeleton associated protein 5 [Hymenolepis microstoma]